MATATVNISFQRKLLDQIDKLATNEARTRSDLIREATRMYIAQKTEWERICALGQSIGTTLDITENDVVGIIKEVRKTSKK
jgi:metal-responsive CopG/Arc/MetJ family transcriptional regulator